LCKPRRSSRQAGCSGSGPTEQAREYEVRLPMSFLSRRGESVFVNPVSSTLHMTLHRLRSLFGGQALKGQNKDMFSDSKANPEITRR
jgi:hypothetical protein